MCGCVWEGGFALWWPSHQATRAGLVLLYGVRAAITGRRHHKPRVATENVCRCKENICGLLSVSSCRCVLCMNKFPVAAEKERKKQRKKERKKEKEKKIAVGWWPNQVSKTKPTLAFAVTHNYMQLPRAGWKL